MSKDKESIQVTIRIRPLSERQLEEDSRVCLKAEETSNLISMNALNGEKESKDFIFDSVCDRTNQEEIFNKVGLRSTQFCMEGYNCTIFAYGQTGAGKTFTMMGVNPENKNYHEFRGLIPRTLEYLFENIENQMTDTGADYMIKCSFVEIYNEQIIDLLGNGNTTLNIRQDIKKGVYIEGVTEQLISRSEEAMEILRKGSKGRHVGSTYYNQTSSRSHSVFTMQIQSQQNLNGVKSTKSRHFHFIDLAGSERTKKSAGQRLREGCSINKSLHVLSTVIGSLAEVSEGKARHINYRDSKLTFLLKDSLGGNSKTHLIANISPSWVSAHETRSTLIFARKVKLIKVNKASINEDSSGNLESLKAEIKRLKSQIIVLKNNGSTDLKRSSLEISNNNMVPVNNSSSNNKMVSVLQQYVDEELEKQTKLEVEFNKTVSKAKHLERGLRHFSDNQKQLRMIISIYEDKIKRLTSVNAKWIHNFEELSKQQKIQAVQEYFNEERAQLLSENQGLKKVTPSVTFVKKLLKQLKIFKQSDEAASEEALVTVLHKNNEFLKQIKGCVENLEPTTENGQSSKEIIKQHKQLKESNIVLQQKIEKQTVQIAEFKDKVQEYETLLEEAIKAQIDVEKKLENTSQQHQEAVTQKQSLIESLHQENNKIEQKNTILSNQVSEIQQRLSIIQTQLLNQKQQNSKLCAQLQKEKTGFQERCQDLQDAIKKREEMIKCQNQELCNLRTMNIELKAEEQKNQEYFEGQLQDSQAKYQDCLDEIRKLQKEKMEIKHQSEQVQSKLEEDVAAQEAQVGQLQDTLEELQTKIKHITQNLKQQTVAKTLLHEQIENQQAAMCEERKKWEQNHKQLINFINKKEETDSEMSDRLKTAQIELIEANEKMGHLEHNSKRQLQLAKQENHCQSLKLIEAEQKLMEQINKIQEITLELSHKKQHNHELTDKLNQHKKHQKLLQSEGQQKQQKINKLMQQVEKVRNKEKESRQILNQQKNQLYTVKKNHQLEVESFRQQIKDHESQINAKQRDNNKIKEIFEKEICQISTKMQLEVKNANANKQQLHETLSQQIASQESKISDLLQENLAIKEQQKRTQQQLNNTQLQINNCEALLQQKSMKVSSLQLQLLDTQSKYRQVAEELEQIQNQKIKEIDELENKYTDEIDEKNAEIIKYQIAAAQHQNSIHLYKQQIQQHQHTKQTLKDRNQQLNRVAIQLQQQCQQLRTTNQQLKAQHHQLQCMYDRFATQKNNNEEELRSLLKKEREEIRYLRESQTHLKAAIKEGEQKIRQVITTKQQVQQQCKNIQQNSENQNNKFSQTNNELQSQVIKLQDQCRQLQAVISQKEKAIDQFQEETKKVVEESKAYKEAVQKQLQENNIQTKQMQDGFNQETSDLHSVIANRDSQITALQLTINQLSKTQHNLESDNQNKNSQITALQLTINQLQKTQQNLTSNIDNLTSQQQNSLTTIINLESIINNNQLQMEQLNQTIDSLRSRQQEQSEIMNSETCKLTIEIDQLNNLYQELKNKKEQLQYQLVDSVSQIEELNKAINLKEEQVRYIQQKQRDQCLELEALSSKLNQQISTHQQQINDIKQQLSQNQRQKQQIYSSFCEIKQLNSRLEQEKEETSRTLTNYIEQIDKSLKITINEAEAWKKRTENLQNQIKLSNQRADKFKKDFSREKEVNSNLKSLIENSQCQINQYKLEVQEKQLQYKKLLEKLARYDTEKKGLASQDRKVSELLEKSRIELNEFKKKYEDQVKINKILKQQLEKKEVDSSIIKQRAEEYCKRQNQVTKSIQADYDKLQKEFNHQKKIYQESHDKMTEFKHTYNELMAENQHLEEENRQLKRQVLKGNLDQKSLNTINRTKEENSQLRRQLEKVKEHLFSETQEKIRLKTEINKFKDLQGYSNSDTSKIELSKKNSEVKHLQKILDDCMQALQIRDYKKLSSESLKYAISELQLKLSKSASDIQRLESELEIKNKKLEIYEKQQRHRIDSKQKQKVEEDNYTNSMSRYKAKIQKCSSTFETMRSKQEDRSILQSKDANKSGWMGKY